MMQKLTVEQFLQLEAFLVNQYGLEVDYQVRVEVLDHVACEIEEKLNLGASYLEASKLVLSKWHILLQPSRFNGYSKVPRFLAKRLIRLDLSVQLGVTLCLLLSFGLVDIPSLTLIYTGLGLLFCSWGIQVWMLRQVKQQTSFAMIYYQSQVKYLNRFNLLVVLALLIGAFFFWNTPAAPYGRAAIWFPCWLLVAYNAYFTYRLYQVKQTTKTIDYV
ncbi:MULTISPECIES: hypothetical protein [unclassified Myroides]|uniref:hypothetical protein n=1 Tax=unclassified Myroides TaxID=2642485 RepID=UPI003D2F77A6